MRMLAIFVGLILATVSHAADTYGMLIDIRSDSRTADHARQFVYHGLVLGVNERDDTITVPSGGTGPAPATCTVGDTARITLTKTGDGSIVAAVKLTSRRITSIASDGVGIDQFELSTTACVGAHASLAAGNSIGGPAIIVLPELRAAADATPAK